MTDYAAYPWPLPDFYQQSRSGSFDDGLERWSGFQLSSIDDIMWPVLAVNARNVAQSWQSRDLDAYVYPEWSSNLFGHILILPSSLALGNVLSNQTQSFEIANLFLTPQQWESLSSDITGLTFVNAPEGLLESPPVPVSIPAFGSFTLQVGIDADGPATIDGTIELGFEGEDISIHVTGVRIIGFPFIPRPDVVETLEWKTDVLIADDGTEQRHGLREAPRQSWRYDLILDTQSDRKLRGLLFDWLARAFAVPIWWEARRLDADASIGDTVISVSTLYADFRVDGLVMLWNSNEAFEMVEIEEIAAGSLTLKSELTLAHTTAQTWVTPARAAYAQTIPSAPRVPNEFTEYGIEFVSIDNIDLSDAGDQAVHDSKLLLDECNLAASATGDAWERQVTVLDNETGAIFQTSRVDRSRYHTAKMWDAPDAQELWRVRQLLHYISGNRRAFFLPTFRDDMTLTQAIAGGSTTLRIADIGFTGFYQSRRPFGDIRLTKTDGTTYTRQVIDSEVDGTNEVLTVASSFSGSTIDIEDVTRIEFVMLMRIADDKASLLHREVGDATISANLISVKE